MAPGEKRDETVVRDASSPDTAKGPTGRLELTWSNKDKALLAHEDGSYEWVGKRDRRVAEVRLLRDAGSVGEVHADAERAKDNLLIRGDALHALTALTELPEFADEYVGKVKLVYIDPPFNTGQAFEHYDDGLEHSVWLTMMRDRLVQIKKLLAPEGSVWVHLDDAEQSYCKVLLDEIFGRDNFITTIIWQKSYTRENRAAISTQHDYIHVYAGSAQTWKGIRNLLPASDAQVGRYANPDDDRRGDWKPTPMHAKAEKGRRQSQFYQITTPSGRVVEPPKGRCWLYTRDRFEEMTEDGRIWFGKSGEGVPTLKKFLSEVQSGLVPVSIWPHDEVGNTGTAKSEIVSLFPVETPFSTPKPERLMERIIHIAANPGEIVLDCFGGSGTTAAVAQKMGRRWVTSERRSDTIDTFTAPRLEKVVKGEDPGGVTEKTGWEGGGGFRVLDVAPSMFEDDHGIVVLADWATSNALGEAVAAQLGFDHELDSPFCGRKGRTRLAVIDGHVNKDVARTLVDALGKGERLSLVATSIEPGVDEALGKWRGGSRARVAPEDLLLAYATPSRWRVSVAREPQEVEQPDQGEHPSEVPDDLRPSEEALS